MRSVQKIRLPCAVVVILSGLAILGPRFLLAQDAALKDPEALQFLNSSIALQNGQSLGQRKQLVTLSVIATGEGAADSSAQYTFLRLAGDRCQFAETHTSPSGNASISQQPGVRAADTSIAQNPKDHFPFLLPSALLQCLVEDPTITIRLKELNPLPPKRESQLEHSFKRYEVVFSRRATAAQAYPIQQVWTFNAESKLPVFVEDIHYRGSLSAPPAIGPFQSLHASTDLRGPRYHYATFQSVGSYMYPSRIRVERPGSKTVVLELQQPKTSSAAASE